MVENASLSPQLLSLIRDLSRAELLNPQRIAEYVASKRVVVTDDERLMINLIVDLAGYLSERLKVAT